MGLFSFLNQEIAIDLGTANTLIIESDKVVINKLRDLNLRKDKIKQQRDKLYELESAIDDDAKEFADWFNLVIIMEMIFLLKAIGIQRKVRFILLGITISYCH